MLAVITSGMSICERVAAGFGPKAYHVGRSKLRQLPKVPWADGRGFSLPHRAELIYNS